MEHITELILTYRYWILLPLSFVEGPIVAFIAGTLASAGYFNPFALAAFFFARDVIVDALCYALGVYGGRSKITKKIFGWLGVTQEHMEDVRKLWNTHPGKTMFLSKLSYGVAAGFIVVAGMVHMPFKKFLWYGAIIAVLHYCTLLVIGYYFGATFGGSIGTFIERAPYVLALAGVIGIAYYFFKRSMTKRLEKFEEEETHHHHDL